MKVLALRRLFVAAVLAVLCAFCHAGETAEPSAAGAASSVRPNVVFILIDDLGWKDLGCTPFSAVRYQDWKLYRYYNDIEGAYQLFDLKKDPYEQKDLSGQHPERLAKLSAMLENWITETDAPMPVPNPQCDPANATKASGMQTYQKSLAIRQESERKK